MNQVSVFGKVFSKVEFFDYVFDTFIELDYAIDDEAYAKFDAEYNILRGILRSYGWEAEYQQWINKDRAVLEELPKAFPTA